MRDGGLLQSGGGYKKGITMCKLIAFINDETGTTAIEYGVIAALISIAAVGAMTTLGSNVTSTFNNVANDFGR